MEIAMLQQNVEPSLSRSKRGKKNSKDCVVDLFVSENRFDRGRYQKKVGKKKKNRNWSKRWRLIHADGEGCAFEPFISQLISTFKPKIAAIGAAIRKR